MHNRTKESISIGTRWKETKRPRWSEDKLHEIVIPQVIVIINISIHLRDVALSVE